MEGRLLGELYEKYSREILLYVYSLCHDREAAEDIMQEVFAKAILSLPERHENFRAWFYTVARNLTYNHTRKTMNRQAALEKLKREELTAEDVTDRIIVREQQRELYQAVQKLNTRYREILTMQYFGDMKLREIGEVLGLTPGNVRVLAHRARKKLIELMKEQGHEIS